MVTIYSHFHIFTTALEEVCLSGTGYRFNHNITHLM